MSEETPELAGDGADRRRTVRRGLGRRVMDALYRSARWVGRHVEGVYAALGLFLFGALGLSILLAGGVALLAEGVMGGATQALDQAVVDWVRDRRAVWLDWLALAGAALGSAVAAWIILGIATLVFWFSRRHFSAGILWIAVLGGRLLSAELKALFDRPRPAPVDWEVNVFGTAVAFPTSPSFPSGHAVTSVVVFGTLTYLIVRLEPTVFMRRVTLAAGAALILLIGLSRVYLGVHYPSDVLAGYLAGFVWATLAAFSVEVLRYVVVRKPEAAPEEEGLEEGIEPIREAVRGEGG